eukprot:CAMPEP_0171672396 /NCGR_PEP_ID=MMETSP0990-20121206/51962_1 /TAXON_ID=483369 /ORGANISM="non described non described, Strain CCMP2098" /LENGTH=81 /DNA_ID=CAMNT_0012257673 /DNA_START=163 /DNA_END=404 /DNA_ORIENTATION=+
MMPNSPSKRFFFTSKYLFSPSYCSTTTASASCVAFADPNTEFNPSLEFSHVNVLVGGEPPEPFDCKVLHVVLVEGPSAQAS